MRLDGRRQGRAGSEKTGVKRKIWLALFLLVVCGCGPGESGAPDMKKAEQVPESWTVERVILTPAESKRLIARGLARYAPVRERMESGTVIITRGSTNTAVVEELLQIRLARATFLTGRFQPEGSDRLEAQGPVLGEVVIRDGVHVPEMKFIEALRTAREGDLIFKGANLVNYREKKAAVCIGHPAGGTMGLFMPFVESGKVRLIIPVGLEKQTSQDLDALELKSRAGYERNRAVPWLKVLPGEIFTEIEAIRQFAEVEVYQLASGGIAGAEGAVTLALEGTPDAVATALEVVASIQGEPPF